MCLNKLNWMSVTYKISMLINKYFFLCFIILTQFFIKTDFRSKAKAMHAFLKKNQIPILKIWQKM